MGGLKFHGLPGRGLLLLQGLKLRRRPALPLGPVLRRDLLLIQGLILCRGLLLHQAGGYVAAWWHCKAGCY